MKLEIWNKSQLESSGSKTCVEPIELELISIHNMQEAKTSRNGPELKLHGAASGDGTSPLFCSNTQSGHWLCFPCTCLCGAVTVLSLNPKGFLSGESRNTTGAHSPLRTQEFSGNQTSDLESTLVYSWPCGNLALLMRVTPRGRVVAQCIFCCPSPQLIPTRKLAEDLAAASQASLP